MKLINEIFLLIGILILFYFCMIWTFIRILAILSIIYLSNNYFNLSNISSCSFYMQFD